ncbi:MAG: hypothetical protein CBARDMAM_0591 [uncultured Caballeronia sp.]|nr:MAG: hypothetical protein CBARDMAM_0591 [uncultured Caballeronia sp.]
MSGGWPLSAVASCRGQDFAGSRLGVQFVDCTAMLVLAVIRSFVAVWLLLICFTSGHGEWGQGLGIRAGVASSGLNMEQHTKHMPAKP